MEDERKNRSLSNLLTCIAICAETLLVLLTFFVNLKFVPYIAIIIVIVSAPVTVYTRIKNGRKIIYVLIVIIIVVFSSILILCSHLPKYSEETADAKPEHTIPEGIERGKLELEFDDFLLSYSDGQKNGTITDSIKNELTVEKIEYESYDYDIKIEDGKIENNIVTFEDIPSGNCKIYIKFENYNLIKEGLTLNKKDMQNGIWKIRISLQEETEYKTFSLKVLDQLGKPLSGSTCDIQLDNISEKLTNVLIDKDGKLPYEFYCKSDSNLTLILHSGENNYTKNIDVSALSGNTEVSFQEVLSQESLEEQEYRKQKEKIERKAAEAEQREAENNPSILLENKESIETKLKQSGNVIQPFTDRLADEERQKKYPISLKQTEPYWIEFNHLNLTEDSFAWKIYIMDNDGNIYIEFFSNMNRENSSSPIVGLQPGDYIIYVESHNSFSDAEYQINLMATDNSTYEGEPNNEILTAQPFPEVQNNQVVTYFGNLTSGDDIDYYSIQIPVSGVLAFKFEHENLTEDKNGWYITLKDANSEILVEFISNWKNTSALSSNIGLDAGTYYIEVKASDSHNSSVYALSSVFHESDSWEAEFNDQVGQSNVLVESFYKYGNSLSGDDVDYYAFQCNKTGSYQLSFEHKNLTEDRTGWQIDILDKNSNSKLNDEFYSDWDSTVDTVTVKMMEGEIYYVMVRCVDYTTEDYKLKLENKN